VTDARPSPANRTYACRAGAITVACENAAHWHALAVCAGRPELAYEGTWDAVRTAPPDGDIARVLEALFVEDAAEVWRRRLEAHGVPCQVTRA